MKKKVTLKNNIKLIYDNNSAVNRIVLSVFFRVGSVYEMPKNYGITHFVEHMFFRRLNTTPQKELYFKMESLGGTLRGRTFRELVCFDISVVPEFFYDAFDIISQILYDFDWCQKDIDEEKKVVINQICFKCESYSEYEERLYFNNINYAIPIMAYEENVEKLELRQINDYKKKYFNCDNGCFIITGAFNESQLKYAIDNLEQINNHGIEVIPKIVYPKQFAERTINSDRIIASSDNISDIWITFDISLNNINTSCIQMLNSILGQGVGSRLPYSLTDSHALTELITSRIDYYNGFARIIIEYSVFNDMLEKSLLLVFDEISDMKCNIKEEDYLSSIIYFTKNLVLQKDDVYELNFNYGWFDYILCREYDLDKMAESNNCITIADLHNTARKIFKSSNMTINIRNNSKILKKNKLKKLLTEIRKKL